MMRRSTTGRKVKHDRNLRREHLYARLPLRSAMSAPEQLLVFEFGPEALFEGHLVGALERVESGGSLRIRSVLFAQREADSGELVALVRRDASASGLVASLLDFRLDAAARRRETARALDGAMGDALARLGEQLEAGRALAAVVVEHRWAEVLADAVARTGGAPGSGATVDARAVSEALGVGQ
jgi:hypothetical protein